MTAPRRRLCGWTPTPDPSPLAEGYLPPWEGATSRMGYAPMVLCPGSRRAVAQIDDEWLGMHDEDDAPGGAA